MNLSLMKDFKVTERYRFQLRAETYNILNHAVFGAPNTQVNNSAFGFITTQANRPRSMLLMGRFSF